MKIKREAAGKYRVYHDDGEPCQIITHISRYTGGEYKGRWYLAAPGLTWDGAYSTLNAAIRRAEQHVGA